MDMEDIYRKIDQEARILHSCMMEYGLPLDELNENVFEMRAELEGRTLEDLFKEQMTEEEKNLPSDSEEAVCSMLYAFLAGTGTISRFKEKSLELLARRIVDEVHRIDD